MPTTLPAILRAVRLRGVFDQRQIVLAANRQQRVQVRRVPVEMDRQDRLGARRDGAFDQLRVQVERRVVNIHIDRLGAHVGNGPTGGDESAGGGDDLIARADVEQQHRDMQRRGAAVEPDAMLRAAKPGEILLELRHVRPEAKRAVVERARDGRVNVFADRPHLRRQIQVRNRLPGFSLEFHLCGDYKQ